MPKSWVREHLAHLDRRFWPAGQRSRYQLGGPPLPQLAGLYEGVRLPTDLGLDQARVPLPDHRCAIRAGNPDPDHATPAPLAAHTLERQESEPRGLTRSRNWPESTVPSQLDGPLTRVSGPAECKLPDRSG